MATDIPSLEDYKENFKLFNKSNATRLECLELIKDLSLTKKQIEELQKIPTLYKETLKEYFEFTNLKAFKENTSENLITFLEKNIKETLEYIKKED